MQYFPTREAPSWHDVCICMYIIILLFTPMRACNTFVDVQSLAKSKQCLEHILHSVTQTSFHFADIHFVDWNTERISIVVSAPHMLKT